MRWALAFILLYCQVAFAFHVVDDEGQDIVLSHPAKRIISLAPDLTELLFAAGAGKNIVGVMRGSDHPEAAKNIPIVADFNYVNVEKVLSLHPDLIVVWNVGRIPEQVKQWGIPVYFSHQQHLMDIPHTIQRFGILAGTSKTADQVANNFIQTLNLLRLQYSYQPPVPVFFELGTKPLITISQKSWINEMIEVCGGKNIFKDTWGVVPEVSVEAVIQRNPSVIIATETNADWKRQWITWSEVTAVQQERLYTIDPDLLERAGPRILSGLQKMCSQIELARA